MTAPAIAPEILTPEQELYRAEKAKRGDRVRPEMVEAAAALRRLDEIAIEAGKGGRPKSAFSIGRPKGRPRAREPDPEMPGRPEWLTPPTPPRDEPPPARHHPTSSTAMPKRIPSKGFEKTCARSGRPYTATGAAQKWCGTCDECVAAAGAAKAPKKKTEKPEKKRTPVRTGFRGEAPRSKRASNGSGLSGAIEHLEGQIADLDARREQLIDMRDKLKEMDAA